MIFLFSTESSETGGGRQRVLLLLLLLIVAGFCYLYFFTNMIVSHEKPAPPPPSAPVKQPIPPRPDQAAPPKEAVAPAKEAVPPAAAVKPSDKQPEKIPPASPATAPAPPAKPAAPAAKVEVAKPAAPSARPAAPQAQDVKKPSAVRPEAPKPAAPPVQGVKPTQAAKPGAEQKAAPAKESAKPVAHGNYVLFVGEYPKGEALQKVRTLLKREGFKPVQEVQVKAVRKMNRLFVAEFADRASAEAEQAKLAKLTSDAFIMREEGAFRLYAGSYLVEKRAAAEKQRLSQKGVAVSVQRIDLPVTTTRVSAGRFATRSDADVAARKLRKAGAQVQVVVSGKKK